MTKIIIHPLIFIFLVVTFACRSDQTDEETNSATNQAVAIVLHSFKEEYKIGENITLRAEITNNKTLPIEIDGFTYTTIQSTPIFSFSEPSAVHLIGPDGDDLFLPYKRTDAQAEKMPPIHIEAGSDHWFRFSISRFLHLRQPGRYTFWLELMDNSGELHRSNQATFQLLAVEPSASPGLIDLDLEFSKPVYTMEDLLNFNVEYEAVFTNKLDKPLTFLKFHSRTGLINPIYEITITNAAGQVIPLMLSDTTAIEPIYNFFTLSSGESYAQSFILPHYPGMREPGEYQIRLTYIVYENDTLTGEPINWEDDVFVGIVESNVVTLKVER